MGEYLLMFVPAAVSMASVAALEADPRWAHIGRRVLLYVSLALLAVLAATPFLPAQFAEPALLALGLLSIGGAAIFVPFALEIVRVSRWTLAIFLPVSIVTGWGLLVVFNFGLVLFFGHYGRVAA
jgi:hypothetical protein